LSPYYVKAWGIKYPLMSFCLMLFQHPCPTSWPHFHVFHVQSKRCHQTPFFFASMSSNDPTFTFSMSLDKNPLISILHQHVHSFCIHCWTSLCWSLSIATPSTWSTSWFALCNNVYVLQEMVLTDYVWNFPIFICRWISSMFASCKQQAL